MKRIITAVIFMLAALMALPASAAVTIRNSGIQASSAASYTVNWPTGTIAGDMAVIHYGGGFGVTSPPAGWGILYNSNQGNWNGLVIWRILTSGDISTGHVIITPSGTFNSTVGIVTVQSGTFDAAATPTIQGIADTGGAATRNVNGFVPNTSDLALYFGSQRQNGAVTVNLGVSQQSITSASASASIYAENPGSTTPSPTFSFANSGAAGDTTFIVGIQAPRTTPGWLRGSGFVSNPIAGTTYTITWPPGTVAGDVDVIWGVGLVLTTPGGWSVLDSCTCANMDGKVVYKVLNSTDISNGGITLTFSSSFNNEVISATVIGSSLGGYSNPVATMQQNITGATSRTVNYTSHTLSDYALYFGSYHASGGTTINLGTYREGLADGVNGAALYVGQPASVGTISPTFSYSNGGSSIGDYQGTVLFAGPVSAGGPSLTLTGVGPFLPINDNDLAANDNREPKLLLRVRP